MNLPQTPSFNLTGKRALVTGASSGIGLACAVALAEAGAEVTLAARSADKLEATAQELKDAGFNALALPLDVADISAMQAAVAEAGPFDILVNSAGLAIENSATSMPSRSPVSPFTAPRLRRRKKTSTACPT